MGEGAGYRALPPLNFFSQGLIWSDFITTVSENYAREIMKTENGAGLDSYLRYKKRNFAGIVNGIDYKYYNPETDRLILNKFDSSSLEVRSMNKTVLQKRTGLLEDVGYSFDRRCFTAR